MFPLLGLASENANFVDGRKKFGYPIKDPIERNVSKNMGGLENVTAVFHWLLMLQVVVQLDGGGRLESSDVSCFAVPVVPRGAMSVPLSGWRWAQHTILKRHYLVNIYRMLLMVPVILWPVRNSNIQRNPPMKSREISWSTYGLSHCQTKWDMT